jgi:uncharacterized protein YyaL (SSP411 family)
MGRGGIYDHLTGGFARYSVDEMWLVPHFEKMLYDNALLAKLYLSTWNLTGDQRFLTTAVEVLDWLDTTMADPAGGLHAAEDADSEGVEGRFAVWTWDELVSVLGDDLELAAGIYGFTESGNFEGANIPTRTSDLEAIAALHGLTSEELESARNRIDAALRAVRATRVPPGRDNKVVAAWNGLALRAFGEAGAILKSDRYTNRAVAIAQFLTTEGSPGGVLVRSWRDKPGVPAFADDVASVALGLYTLFQTTGDERWFTEAENLVQSLRSRFADASGGFYATADDAEDLITRPKNIQDNPTPSDNALAMEALQIHSAFTGDLSALDEVEQTMAAMSVVALRHPSFAGQSLAVWLAHTEGLKEVAVTGTPDAIDDLIDTYWNTYRPASVVAVNRGEHSVVPLLQDRPASATPTAYVCQRLVCELPVHSGTELAALLAP